MANDEHLALLAAGAQEWNAWRDSASDGAPDLRGADLSERVLDRVNLRGADLRGTVLVGSSLKDADLRDAGLQEARLDGADLSAADLSGATLDAAVLARAQMQDATIHGGSARAADLRGIQGWHLSVGAFLPSYPDTTDVTGANLNRAWLPNSHLSGVLLDDIQARDATFDEASLANISARRADFSRAKFSRAWLDQADFTDATLARADLSAVRARGTVLSGTDLRGAGLVDADLRGAIARDACLEGADLGGADLRKADFEGADFTGADLSLASLVGTSLERARLSRARVYGASAWSLRLDEAAQDNLVITPADEPTITVDDLEVAQFVYLMLDNGKIRNVLDTVTSKTVLILGRFTADRKAVLDAIRDHLRTLDFVSIIFDFDRPATRNLTETITLLARMARFVIADLTDPSSVPLELQAIVGDVGVPLQPLIEHGDRPFGMFVDLLARETVLPLHRYADAPALLRALSNQLLPALEETRRSIAERRAGAYAQLEGV
jgi:uncharacterized protein YjbI with pentapeptide repeats